MKKILTNLLDVLVLLLMMVPTVSFLVLKGLTWLSEKSVDAIDFLREKLRLDPDDTPKWIDRAGAWLIKIMD